MLKTATNVWAQGDSLDVEDRLALCEEGILVHLSVSGRAIVSSFRSSEGSEVVLLQTSIPNSRGLISFTEDPRVVIPVVSLKVRRSERDLAFLESRPIAFLQSRSINTWRGKSFLAPTSGARASSQRVDVRATCSLFSAWQVIRLTHPAFVVLVALLVHREVEELHQVRNDLDAVLQTNFHTVSLYLKHNGPLRR